MARDASDSSVIESRDQLVAALEFGCKPPEKWRIGTEHEKLMFNRADFSPVPYDGPRGIRRLLELMEGLLGWQPIVDHGHIIGLSDPIGLGAISLEPGGQFELSGAPVENIHQTAREINAHLAQVRECADVLGLGMLGIGLSPKWTLAETPIMPKSRYEIMRRYMPKVGAHGLDMMFRTCTVQTNLDFSDEADMRLKMRVGLALQPIVTALFANSPFLQGKPNGYLSYRAEIWRDTDADRTGNLPFAFEDGFGFERYVDWALDVPMYFVKRGDVYHDVAGASFRDLLAGKLPALPERARDVVGLAQSPEHALPRRAPQELHRDARRRRRARPANWRRCPPSGSASFTIAPRSMPRGPSSATGPPRKEWRSAMAFPAPRSPRHSAAARFSTSLAKW